ncbi:hypothetical protein ACJGE4_20625 (plasmid) [Bacillus velezensis]|uniref:hypothetical protein n=1 Tax=Bacillus TaxID=1386 RepID=UPI001C5E6AB3|nr:hypothetical protein [Bacillus amyloliquefaciens]QYC35327.1 hypothetical protein J5X95_20680 [Bacillus amyloliquefaciens]QYC35370.1 hypothetical protein J5X95_20300 [Bacillus amyloliquefaciens]
MIIVNIDMGHYELKIILDGDYQTEQERLGDNFEEQVFKKAIAQAKRDGWTLPLLKKIYEVTEG